MTKKLLTFSILTLLFFSGKNVAGETEGDDEANQSNDLLRVFVKELDYKRPKNLGNKAGNFSFRSFNMQNGYFYTNFDNSKEIFDTSIIINPGFLGFKGDSYGFGFTLEEEDSIHKLEKANVVNSAINMNSRFIDVSGGHFDIDVDDTQIILDKFKLFCTKHPDYQELFSLDTFLYGCFSRSRVTPLEPEQETLDFSVNFRMSVDEIKDIATGSIGDGESEKDEKDEKGGGKYVDFKVVSKVKKIQFDQNLIRYELPEMSIGVDGDYSIDLLGMEGRCNNYEDIKTFSPKRLVESCVNDFYFFSRSFTYGSKQEDSLAVTLDQSSITVNEKKFNFVTNEVVLNYPKSRLSLNNIHFQCDKDISFAEISKELFVHQCFNNVEIGPTPQTEDMLPKLAIDMETENGTSLEGFVDLEKLEIGKHQLHLKSPRAQITFDNKNRISLDNLNGTCVKDEITHEQLEQTDYGQMVTKCLNGLTGENMKLSLTDLNSGKLDEMIFNIRKFRSTEDKIFLNLSSVEMKDEDGSSRFEDVLLSCSKNGIPVDFRDLNSLIMTCTSAGYIRISRMISKGKESYRDLILRARDGKASLTTVVKFLGMLKKVKLGGTIHLDRTAQNLIFKVKWGKLPFGICNKKLVMIVLGIKLNSDRIDVKGDEIIIKL